MNAPMNSILLPSKKKALPLLAALSLLVLPISQVQAAGPVGHAQFNAQSGPPTRAPNRYCGKVAYAPAGLVIPITLSTGISTTVAQAGDPVQARVSQTMQLGGARIPEGSIVRGQITDAAAASRMGHGAHLGIKFTHLTTPDGGSYPLNAHLIGGLEKYHQEGAPDSDQFRGETGQTKLKAAGVRGLIGAGSGALLGTAVGGIAGGGRGAGRGAWSGTAIGAGLGVADSLLLRKGREINLKGGTAMQLQLDSPVSIAANEQHIY
jgi:hypothetical protein